MHQLYSYDWTHVFVTKRSLTFDDKTYNLKTQMWVEFKVPDEYYGQENSRAEKNAQEEQPEDEDDEPDEKTLEEEKKKIEKEGVWEIS